MRLVLWVVAVGVLTSCVNSPSDKVVDALEIKAKAGDSVAACQLVVHDLRQCVGALEQWSPSSPRRRLPSCLDDPVPEEHQRYLADSVGWVEGAPAETLGSLLARDTRILEAILRLAPTDEQIYSNAIGILDETEKACPHLVGDG